MKYYLVTKSADPNEIGYVEQQLDEYLIDEDSYSESRAIRNIPQEGLMSPDINVPALSFKAGAKKTDLVGNLYVQDRTLLLSSRAYDFISKFDLDEVQSFSCKISFGRRLLSYELLYMPIQRQESWVSWEKSIFSIVNRYDYVRVDGEVKEKEIENIHLNNYQEYIDKLREVFPRGMAIRRKKLVAVGVKWDLFRLRFLDIIGFVCSENLKIAIEQNRFTGFHFRLLTTDVQNI